MWDQAGWIDGKDAKDTQQQSTDKKYKSYIEDEEFLKAYKLKENKASEIKKAALEQKDYVEAVKLADMTDDNEYLMNIYLQNGNEQGLKEKFNEMSYEERLSLNEDTQRKIADTFLKNKDYKAAEKVNETLKNKEITEKIKGQVKKKDIATKTAANNTDEGMKN